MKNWRFLWKTVYKFDCTKWGFQTETSNNIITKQTAWENFGLCHENASLKMLLNPGWNFFLQVDTRTIAEKLKLFFPLMRYIAFGLLQDEEKLVIDIWEHLPRSDMYKTIYYSTTPIQNSALPNPNISKTAPECWTSVPCWACSKCRLIICFWFKKVSDFCR